MRSALIALLLTACAAPYQVTVGEPVYPPQGAYTGCVSLPIVESVTADFQDRFEYTEDHQDEWQTLTIDADTGTARGDCEDYALSVQQRLLNIGYQPHTARMAITQGGRHAVLVVQSCEAGQVVVDNQNRGAVVPVSYYPARTWVMIQNKGTAWGRAAVVRPGRQ